MTMQRKRAAAVLAAVVVLAVVAWLVFGRGGDGEADGLEAAGTVEATTADLGFKLPGRIAAVVPAVGAGVAVGDVLARLEVSELEAQRAAADAQIATARAQLEELERGARPEERAQLRAALDGAQQVVEDAERDLQRAERLEAAGAVSRQTLDKARTAHEVAVTQARQAQAQYSAVERGVRAERIAAGRAQVAAARAARAQVDATIANAVVAAPFAGVVTIRHREPGEVVAAGQPVLTVMNPADRWVRIYVREDRIGQVALGQPARITSDSHPDRTFEGHVVHIASEAEFTPRNVQTAEERVKLVYAVRVQIVGDAALALKPGVPADVTLAAGT
jgi:HlyD family secretion protein